MIQPSTLIRPPLNDRNGDSVGKSGIFEAKEKAKEDVNEPPKEGIYVYGLFLDGAGWNKRDNMLAEQAAKVLFVNLPVIHIYAINSTAGRDTRQYECPIYRKPRRTDQEYITMVDLKTKTDPMHWTLRGVALLCDTK